MKAKPASEERARLQAVRSVDLEDARPVFERIARTAQRLSGAPFAHVTIVGRDEVWLAGVSAEPLEPVAREHAFVFEVVESDAVFWVEDLSADRRFAANPFVKDGPRFRGYAAAPVVLSDGRRIGAVSIKDWRPRSYDGELAAGLRDLAALVALEWERGRALKALKRSEAEARAAHAMMERVVDGAPVGLLMTDRHLRVLRSSQQLRRAVALTDADLRGHSLEALFPYARELWAEELELGLAGQTTHSEGAQLPMPDGRQIWLRSEITPWRDRRGRIGGLLIMAFDITDMVEAIEAHRRTEQTLKLALEIGEVSMWELDHRDRRFNSAGKTAIDGQGRSFDDMQRDIWYGVHPHDRPHAEASLERSVASGEPFRAVFRVMQRDGPHVWVQSAADLIRNEQGEIDRVVGVLRNIDKQKRGEMALAKARDEAEAANRAKSEFLANMSHEIRTPLNGVMGVASALSRTRLDGNQREMVGLIGSSAKTLEALLSDVLDLARVESGRLSLASEPFDLARCVADVGALFHPGADAKGLGFVVECGPNVEGVFLGDAPRIRQILSNLVANAVKFTEAGEVRLSATALRTPDGIEATIRVKDTGIGFDEATKARLFGRFEQADGSITRRYGGTGLGLAISRSLAERLGGVLEADSSPGGGSIFTLRLPLARAEAPLRAEAESCVPDSGPSAADRAPLKVLLAEDHPTNRRVVQLILEAAGVVLTCVENGALAVEAWETGAFDLVLMDMQMPVMDGLTAIRAIREREAAQGRPRSRIHALTANAMPEHAEASRAAGADGHLTKPISADQLFRAVEEAWAAPAAQEASPRRAKGRMNGA
ncbi:MAG: ATP-binding protein [Caulobacteraceae bacterium]